MLDLRRPSGWFFAILGLILVVRGIFSPEVRAALTEANINLYCGAVMFVFGAIMLLLSRTRS